ncbi:type II toxin-antitoxin system RelE family toxin [Methanoregula sp.]|uniref:type II toxin-antitoxin system RelE family toxin n=1 Tax=Methanoregula sp. TaxID=2052170 RepID=UPI003BB0B451
MEVQLERSVIKTLDKYPEKIREHIFNHLRKLEDPYSAPDVECLHSKLQIYRMHVGRTYTIIFRIKKELSLVLVLDLLTIEQAHKRYGRYY